MKIFAISDLHLSGNPPTKPMEIFGQNWLNHWQKIKHNWVHYVTEEDIVLIPGDISWAMKLEEALVDLQEIQSLPGQKIFVRGNHDYWWQTVTKMRKLLSPGIEFLQNNHFSVFDWAICGSRGWIYPSDPTFSAEDTIIYERELKRVEMSLNSAKTAGLNKIILMLHYPPFISHSTQSGFKDLIEKYNVSICIYGHLHDVSIINGPQGLINHTTYHLVSCDALKFQLKELLAITE